MDPTLESHPLYAEAREHVRELRGFYGHALAYVFVIGSLALMNFATTPDHWWVQWPAFGWGLGLAIHALTTFTRGRFFGRDWEERRIREYLRRDGSR